MARKITMFELHFDGAHFGPSVPGGGEESMREGDVGTEATERAETTAEESADASASRSRLLSALAIVGVLSVASLAGVAIRRFRADDDLEIEVGTGSDEDLLEEKH